MDFRSINEFFKDMSKYIIVIIIVFITFIFIIGLQQVIGPSMSPNLNEGDLLLVNKFQYKVSDIKRGDIVVLTQDDKYMIKRVIGLPGEKIEYKNNNLYINEKMYEESYLNEKVITNDFNLDSLNYQKIPKDKYLVLGDNRENSLDSRKYGLVDKKNIKGKSYIRIWPINKIGLVK